MRISQVAAYRVGTPLHIFMARLSIGGQEAPLTLLLGVPTTPSDRGWCPPEPCTEQLCCLFWILRKLQVISVAEEENGVL